MAKNKLFTLLFSLFFFAAVYGFFVPSVFAAAPKLELSYPGLGVNIPSVPDFVAWIFKFALGASGALAFGVLVFGGIKYITSAGNASAQGDAKQWIQGALLGLLLLLGSVLILGTINPSLTTFGVPGEPDFKFGSANVILEPSTYIECIKKTGDLSGGSCGCSIPTVNGKSGGGLPLPTSLSCPTFTAPDPIYVATFNWCVALKEVCAESTFADPVFGVLYKNIYCCSGPVP